VRITIECYEPGKAPMSTPDVKRALSAGPDCCLLLERATCSFPVPGQDLPFMQLQVLAAKPSFVALGSRWGPLLPLFKYRIEDRVVPLGVVGERRSDPQLRFQ
jgi:hypothetical protein